MYIFNHVPKCGGLSYRALLEEIFGNNKVIHLTINLEQEYAPSPDEYREYTVIMGHFGVRWNDIIGPGRRWMTALRDPIDRTVSTYYFWRHNAPISSDSPWLYLAQTKSLDDFVHSFHYFVRQGIENLQTWQLADDLRWRYHTVSDQDALEVAKENLWKFGFVGLYEEFGLSIERMCRFLGKVPPPALPRVNKTKKRPSLGEISASTIEAIMELNQADLELYQYAKKMFYGNISRKEMFVSRTSSVLDSEHSSMLPLGFEDSKGLRIRAISVPSKVACRDVMEAVVEVLNDGSNVWSSGRPNPLFVSYHWFDEAGGVAVFDGWRSEIHPVLEPWSSQRVRLHVVAPPTPGTYTLRITLVQEFVRWFDTPPLNCFQETNVTVEDTIIESAVFSPGHALLR